VEHEWEIDGLESLIDTLNRAFAPCRVKALVLLGEWEDMLQVWRCQEGREHAVD